MLRDDAIRTGLIEPNADDVERMGLSVKKVETKVEVTTTTETIVGTVAEEEKPVAEETAPFKKRR